jgi:undecaprenyl pyrophosphate phosphatase UppP
MNSLMGMDFESWRIITVIGTIGAVLLYVYRISCLINLMRSESEKLAGNNRLIYAGLILLIPLGIGAWLYEFIVNEKTVSPLFIFPFCIVVSMFLYGMLHILPNATQFNFDYMGW